MRVCLFTDTLGDVNGVSRFIQNAARCALDSGRDLRVLTSTRFEIPAQDNIINFPPLAAPRMPKYENLELAFPPMRTMIRAVRQLRPDAIHISTPGPIGTVGRIAARKLRIPMLGVYHTDFPAYIDHLFQEEVLTQLCSTVMTLFYRRFARIFTRSDDYAKSLMSLGIARDRITRLLPGIDTSIFHSRFKNTAIWNSLGIPHGIKVIYCGRVSVEKNLPFLVKVWQQLPPNLGVQLIVIGDGPYRAQMQRELPDAYFLGFKKGVELSTLYASADLFIFPSTTDTLGQVVMESQSSGLPVLVTNEGGPKEVVRHGETGLVLSARDPGAWVRAIVDLVNDEPRRRAWGTAAHEFIQPMSIAHSFDHFWQVHEEEVRRANPGILAA